jgi:hypothetical protein
MDWEVRSVIAGFSDIAAANGKFVAVGPNGAVGVTCDGFSWRISSVTTNSLAAIFHSEELFVAISYPPVSEFFASKDGLLWRTYSVHPEVEGHATPHIAALANFLETWVAVTNSAVETGQTQKPGDELRALYRATFSGK